MTGPQINRSHRDRRTGAILQRPDDASKLVHHVGREAKVILRRGQGIDGRAIDARLEPSISLN